MLHPVCVGGSDLLLISMTSRWGATCLPQQAVLWAMQAAGLRTQLPTRAPNQHEHERRCLCRR